MRAPVRAICRPDVAVGLGLAGLPVIEADDGAAAAAAIDELAASPASGGVLLVEQALYDALPAPLLRRVRRDGAPIVVPFPSPSLAGERRRPAEEEILEILRQAVGYRLRLR